jgi:hypothetical protein
MMTARAAKTWFFICVFTRESHLAFCLLGALGVHKYLKIYDLINLVCLNYANTHSNILNDFSKSYPT